MNIFSNPQVRAFFTFLIFTVFLIAGCNSSTTNSPQVAGQNKSGTGSTQKNSDEPKVKAVESRPAIKTTRMSTGGPTRQTNRDAASLTETAAVNSMTSVLSEYAQSEPALVIWLVDSSAEAIPLASTVTGELRRWYEDSESSPTNLETVVARFSSDVEYLIETPSRNMSEISTALSKARGTGTEPGSSMRALAQILERYRRARETEGKLVLVGLVTAGNVN